ncbi:hypothetical protein [Streptomyces misionensis]|uniref:hypothetical protein n=1 Tax=Streptomyces misionensis TaxID=67331 RepID=UPI00368DE991
MSRPAKAPRVSHQAAAARLREHPQTWLIVGDYRSRTTADDVARRIRSGYPIGAPEYGTPYEPIGAYESRTELVEDGTRVHARYIGETA